MKALLMLLSSLSFFQVSHAQIAPVAASAEDWDFTRADYSKLIQSGGTLRFEADSNWLPQPLQQNILTTLAFALDPQARVHSADGINVRDFYHGHIECVQSTIQGEIAFSDTERLEAIFGSLGLQWFDLNEQNFATYQKGIKQMEQECGQFLHSVVDTHQCELAIIYHTYEVTTPENEPSIAPEDPRRNLLTRQKDLIPTHFTPVRTLDRLDLFNHQRPEFRQILQVAFLVDHDGVVHATQGSLDSLSRVTGFIPRVY